MLEANYLKRVRWALRKEGIWGVPAQRVVDELADHFRAKVQALEQEGRDRETAEREALQTLGTPANLATASREILRESLPARHPWLVCGLGVFLAVTLALYELSRLLWVYGPMLEHTMSRRTFYDFLFTCCVLINWVPWILGAWLLLRLSMRFPMGWKSLLIGCVTLGVASTSIQWWITYPFLVTPGTDAMDFNHQLWTRPLIWMLDHFCYPGLYRGEYPCLISPLDPQALVKQLAPIFACLGFRYFFTTQHRLTGAPSSSSNS